MVKNNSTASDSKNNEKVGENTTKVVGSVTGSFFFVITLIVIMIAVFLIHKLRIKRRDKIKQTPRDNILSARYVSVPTPFLPY